MRTTRINKSTRTALIAVICSSMSWMYSATAADICCGGQLVPEEQCCNDVVLGQDEVCCENEPTAIEQCCSDTIMEVDVEDCCWIHPDGPRVYQISSECCTEVGFINKADPLPQNLDDCPDRVARNPPVPSSNNGECGDDESRWVPDSFLFVVSFSSCCIDHDECYTTCNSGKSTCDAALSSCMAGKCASTIPLYLFPSMMVACLAQAQSYSAALTMAPQAHSGYISAQREACQCCP
jgi:hypothetical protein